MNGIELIAAERQRQIEQEGWTPDHDDEHDDGSLAAAAACYALPMPIMAKRVVTRDDSGGRGECPVWRQVAFNVPKLWPVSWAPEYWNPKDRVRDLVRAGALIAAEIDRIQRTAAAQDSNGRGNTPTSEAEQSVSAPASAAAQYAAKSKPSPTILHPADGWPFPETKA